MGGGIILCSKEAGKNCWKMFFVETRETQQFCSFTVREHGPELTSVMLGRRKEHKEVRKNDLDSNSSPGTETTRSTFEISQITFLATRISCDPKISPQRAHRIIMSPLFFLISTMKTSQRTQSSGLTGREMCLHLPRASFPSQKAHTDAPWCPLCIF